MRAATDNVKKKADDLFRKKRATKQLKRNFPNTNNNTIISEANFTIRPSIKQNNDNTGTSNQNTAIYGNDEYNDFNGFIICLSFLFYLNFQST